MLYANVFLLMIYQLITPFVETGMGNTSKWKESLAERTSSRQHVNLMKLVYGKLRQTSTTSSNEAHDTSDEESDRGEFFRPIGEINKVYSLY